MSATRHSKVEHFLIHLVAILFLFSSLSAGFLGYGVYQTKQPGSKPQPILVQPKTAQAAGFSNKVWYQNSWTGGEDTNNSYVVDWGGAWWMDQILF